MIDMEEDAAALPSNDKLLEIAELADKAQQYEREIERTETELASLKTQYRMLVETTIPAVCAEAGGLTQIKLTSGVELRIDNFVDARISAEHAPAAFEWLRANGHDDIIKRELTLQFGRGDDKQAELVRDELCRLGLSPTDRESVHPGTLKAFVRERMETGQAVPTDMFGVFTGQRAKIVRPGKGGKKK